MSSFTVYQNYPSLVDKMANPTDLDFSPNSGYLAAGTSKGIVHMYRYAVEYCGPGLWKTSNNF